MNTTSGHQADTIVWTSDNDMWAIERRDTYHRNGEIDRTTWFIYGGYLAVRWPITDATLDNDFYPKYVRQAIRRHVTAEFIENKRKSRTWRDMAIRFGEAM